MNQSTESPCSFVLQFSWCKVPDSKSMHNENGEPNGSLAVELGQQLAARGPMLSCVFYNNGEDTPTVSQLHKAVQSEYMVAEDQKTHETYGMLLDTLRRLHLNEIALSHMDEEEVQAMAESYTAPLTLPLNAGALVASEDVVCMLYLSTIRSFRL